MAQMDMTAGNIPKSLIRYSLPLILGNVFQLTYNLVDAVIAGRCIGKHALAAAGIASPVMNILILSISGLSMGAGVLMSEFYGAGDRERLRRELGTVSIFGVAFSLCVVLLGVLITPGLLRLLRTPADIFDMTVGYLRIIFLGAPFTYFYNALSAALKSVGDSKTPLRFLMISSLLNAVLDIIFIGFLGFGIVCSAVTTVVAEAASALLSVTYIYRKIPDLALTGGELRLDGALLGKTLKYGAFTALQQASLSIGKLLVQGCVNPLGVDAIAAFNAVTRVDDFAFTPEQSIAHGITTFVAQNRGKAQAEDTPQARMHAGERIHRGFRVGMGLESCYWVLICAVTLLLRRPLILLFGEKGTEVMVELGCQYLGLMAFFYIMPALTNGLQGYFRGCGRMWVTFCATTLQIIARVGAAYLLVPKVGLSGVAWACLAGWVVMVLFEGPQYLWARCRSGLGEL